tara:strand:+ start:36 stop:233 length:198 start_codon:yes stop_codon:yes gene_type:complete
MQSQSPLVLEQLVYIKKMEEMEQHHLLDHYLQPVVVEVVVENQIPAEMEGQVDLEEEVDKVTLVV